MRVVSSRRGGLLFGEKQFLGHAEDTGASRTHIGRSRAAADLDGVKQVLALADGASEPADIPALKLKDLPDLVLHQASVHSFVRPNLSCRRDLPFVKSDLYDSSERMDYGDAATPLAVWLRSQISDTPLQEIERRSRKAGVPILASSLSDWLHDEAVPGPRSVRRLATFFNVPEAEVVAVLPDPLGDKAAGQESDADVVRGAKDLLLEAVGDLSAETIAALAQVIRETKGQGRGARRRSRS